MTNSKNIENAAVTVDNLQIGYSLGSGKYKRLVSDIHVELLPGELVCLIGSNGSGKSTLIRTMCGLQQALGGKIFFQGKVMKGWNKEIARSVSVVLTDIIHGGHLTVFDLVSMGRYPHTKWMGNIDKHDKEIILESIHLVGLDVFVNSKFDNLSDGEKQRVMIAKALAQDTDVILLDEPTAHLDIFNRVEIVNLLCTLAHQEQKAILLSIHDLELALRTTDIVWLLHEKKLITGAPEDLIISGLISETFKGKAFNFDTHSGTFKILNEQATNIYFNDTSVKGHWTCRALERLGFRISDDKNEAMKLVLHPEKGQWELTWKDERTIFYSIGTLTKCLRLFLAGNEVDI